MTVSTLRPSSTTSNTGALTGGATAHAVLNDNSDASYVEFDAGEASRVGLDDFSLPAGAVIKALAIRLRTKMNSLPGSSAAVTARLLTSAGAALSPPVSQTIQVTWTSITTSTAVTVQGSFTDPVVDDAVLDVGLDAGDTNIVDLYEGYVDVTYVAKPTVVITSPSGTVTDDDTPTVQWTDTLDSDGGAQTHFRAVYMANGEHPDTHTPIADSGIVASADASWAPTTSLANATYDVYVKVAQTVNGNQHWSAWDDQQDVILNVPPPATPTSLTVTPESSSGRIKLEVVEGSGGTVITDKYRFQRSRDGGTTWEDIRTLEGGGILEVPTLVGSVAATADSADGTTHNASLPTPAGGILPDDLLIAFVAMDGNPTVAWPADWTEIKDEAGNGSAVRVACAWKRAAGGESGTIAITTSASEGGAVHILCIRGASTTTAPAISSGANASGTSADSDSLNPSGWGTENTLWIAAAGNDGNVAISSGPTGYFGFLNTRWANASGAGIATAIKRTNAASEDPGAFTLASAEDSRAFVVGVRPAQASPIAYDFEAGNGESVKHRVAAIHNFPAASSSQSAWVTSGANSWSSTEWWLKHCAQPDLNCPVVVHAAPAMTRPVRQGSFAVLGAKYPVVVDDTRGGPVGTIVFRLDTAEEQDALVELLDDGATVLLQGRSADNWTDRWVRFGDQESARVADKSWIEPTYETVPWIEVAEPENDLAAWPSA